MNEKSIDTTGVSPEALEALLARGDLNALNDQQKVNFIAAVCKSVGLNPLTRPFDFMKTRDGKQIIYANKGCAEQLRQVNKISLEIVERELIKDVYVVTAKATSIKDGRVDSATGAVSIGKLFGEALANAYMKAETKAKRRVTLSICGLNMLDETEASTIPRAKQDVTPSDVTKNVTTQSVSGAPPQQNAPPVNERRVFTVGQLEPDQVVTLIAMAKSKGITSSSTFNNFIETRLGKSNGEVVKEDYDKLFTYLTGYQPAQKPQGEDRFEEPPHPGS